jgi:transposase
MGRPPVIPAEKKERVVLAVLAREVTIVEAARREQVSEQSVGRWKAEFLEAGRAALSRVEPAPASRVQQLEAELSELIQELRRAEIEIEVWKTSAGSRLGPSTTSR